MQGVCDMLRICFARHTRSERKEFLANQLAILQGVSCSGMVFVAAHVGAGYHSSGLESAYLSDLKAACHAAHASMQQGNGLQATVAGICILEVS